MLDKNIKSKLDQREIQPSPEAWSKLDAQLNVHQQAKNSNSKKNSFSLWIGIAASILVIIVASIVFKIDQNTSPKKPQSTSSGHITSNNNTPPKEKINSPEQNSLDIATKEKIQPISEAKDNPLVDTENKTSKKLANHQKKVEPIKPLQKPVEIKETMISTTEIEFQQDLALDTDTIIELLSADELLEKAMQKHRINKESSIAIDSRQLLNVVEDDIFQEKSPDLLEKLTQQIKTIQVAINERNEEK